MMRSCSTCKSLKDCSVVSEKRIIEGYYCDSWELAYTAEMNARNQLTQEFGPWVLRFENPKLQTAKSASTKARRRHRNG